jgi:hypothetical protein
MLRLLPTLLSAPANTQVLSDVISNPAANYVMSVSIHAPRPQDVLAQLQETCKRLSPTSALELHQAAEELISQARQLSANVDFVMALALEDKSIFAAKNGTIILKRGQKIGRILQATEEIIVVEGSQQSMDEFIWLTGNVSDATIEWIKKQWLAVTERLPEDMTQLSITRVEYGQAEEVQIPSTSPTLSELGSPQKSVQSNISAKKVFAELSNLVGQMGPVIKKSLLSIRQMFKGLMAEFFSNDVYVRQKNKKKILRVFLPIIAVGIVGAITVIVMSSQRSQQVQAAQQIFEPLNSRLTEIKKVVDQDPLTARQQTEDVIVELEHAIEKEKNHKTTAAELTKRLQETRQFYDSISGKEEQSVLPTFYDLRFVESAFLANKVDLVDSTLVFLDQGQKKVLAVNAENKQYTSLPIGDLPVLKDIDLESKSLYLLADGVSEFKMSESQSAQQLKASDDQLQDAQLIRFFNQYLYVLNPAKRNIFRYSFTDAKTLSDAAGWIRQGTTLEFDKVQSFAIDGDVWVSTKDGKINKFTSGKEMEFTVVGLPEPFAGPITLYTNQDLTNLYVLEPGQDRFVILNKKGEFMREVKSSSLRSTTTVVVSEKLKKAFAVSGALVFEIGL